MQNAKWLLQWRYAKHLSRVDLVGMSQHGPVGFEDDGVFHGIAVVLFGDFREGISGLDGIKCRLWFGIGHAKPIVDAFDALDVADGQDDFFGDFSRLDIAVHYDGAFLNGHGEVFHRQAERHDFLFESRLVEQRLGGWRCLLSLLAKNGFTSIFQKRKQSHTDAILVTSSIRAQI